MARRKTTIIEDNNRLVLPRIHLHHHTPLDDHGNSETSPLELAVAALVTAAEDSELNEALFGRQSSGDSQGVLSTQQQKISRGRGRPPGSTKKSSTPAAIRHSATGNTLTPSKGLRHFSAQVAAKVEEKGTTTYNEVADELVAEMIKQPGPEQRNLRRRVYDALNVLMAIDVIRKDRKEIRWVGFPEDMAHSARRLHTEHVTVKRRLEEKRRALDELMQRYVCLKALVARNGRMEAGTGSKASINRGVTALMAPAPTDRLHLPFVLINAPKDCRVHCEMLEDRSQYCFEFDAAFSINDDIEVLKLLGFDRASSVELSRWLPRELLAYCRTNSTAFNQHLGPLLPATDHTFFHDENTFGANNRAFASSPGRSRHHHHNSNVGNPSFTPGLRRNLFSQKHSTGNIFNATKPASSTNSTFFFPEFSLPAVSETDFEDAFSHALFSDTHHQERHLGRSGHQ